MVLQLDRDGKLDNKGQTIAPSQRMELKRFVSSQEYVCFFVSGVAAGAHFLAKLNKRLEAVFSGCAAFLTRAIEQHGSGPRQATRTVLFFVSQLRFRTKGRRRVACVSLWEW